jgi:Short C-terminal domain
MKLTIASLLTAVLLGACAVSSPIQKYSESNSAFGKNPPLDSHNIPASHIYRVYEQGATGYVPISAVRESAEKRAEDFCTRQGKGMSALGEQISHPPYILGNFPRIEIVFACVDKSSATRPAVQDEQYTKLHNLKKLLDDGVITQDEFERQKAKILNAD